MIFFLPDDAAALAEFAEQGAGQAHLVDAARRRALQDEHGLCWADRQVASLTYPYACDEPALGRCGLCVKHDAEIIPVDTAEPAA